MEERWRQSDRGKTEEKVQRTPSRKSKGERDWLPQIRGRVKRTIKNHRMEEKKEERLKAFGSRISKEKLKEISEWRKWKIRDRNHRIGEK